MKFLHGSFFIHFTANEKFCNFLLSVLENLSSEPNQKFLRFNAWTTALFMRWENEKCEIKKNFLCRPPMWKKIQQLFITQMCFPLKRFHFHLVTQFLNNFPQWCTSRFELIVRWLIWCGFLVSSTPTPPTSWFDRRRLRKVLRMAFQIFVSMARQHESFTLT